MDASQTVQREISRGAVALYKEYVGRGPTYARTYVNEDAVTIILGDSLLPAEQRLSEGGRVHTVRQIRRDFQEAMEDAFTTLIEGSTGRKVACLLSDHNPNPDYAAEVFVLEPKTPA